MKVKFHSALSQTIIITTLIFAGNYSLAQIPPHEYKELSSDPYIHVAPLSYKTSPAYFFQNEIITTYQVNINEQGQNKLGDAANEPSLVINPTNPQHMAIGWRQFDTIASNFRQAGYAFTIDGGKNWINQGKIEAGVFRSDPVLESDAYGKFFYNSLTTGLRCDIFRSLDNFEWDEGVPAYGGDKQWMAIDKTDNPSKGNIYATWNINASSCDGDFNYSFDGGETFSTCTIMPRTNEGGTIHIGPNGELYQAAGFSGLYFGSCTNVLEEDAPLEWDFFEDISSAGVPGFEGPNPEGLLGQTWVDTDHSNGPYHGNIYVVATLAYNDNADILFYRSSNGGLTWDLPGKMINSDEEGNYNWFGTMSVAPNGRIDICWLDTRDTPGSHDSALYYSYSEDGGETFSPNEKLSEIFDPHLGYPKQQKMGDYFHMRSDNECAHLAWAATFNGEQDVYFSRICLNEVSAVGNISTENPIWNFENHPNPFHSETNISFENKQAGLLTLEIFDLFGNNITTLLHGHYHPGKHDVNWNGTDSHENQLPAGIYVSKLSFDNTVVTSSKLILIR